MSYDNPREILRTSDDGRYRAVRFRDEYPHQPENDGETPILRVDRGSWNFEVKAHNRQANPYADAFDRLYNAAPSWPATLDTFERYLRIFHGMTNVVVYGPNNYTDYEYISFDTDEWAESMGITNEEHRPKMAGESLEETIAWLEGEVYILTVEEHRTGACGHEDCDEHMSWEEVEDEWKIRSADGSQKVSMVSVAIGGFYGDNEYSRSEAVDYHFGDYFETTKAA